MEMPGIKTAVFFGLVSMSPFFLLGSPLGYSQALTDKKTAVATEIAYRCAQPNVIEVTRHTWAGLQVHKCNKRNSS
jgi:hypothetical protein